MLYCNYICIVDCHIYLLLRLIIRAHQKLLTLMTHERCEKVNAIFKEIHANTLKFGLAVVSMVNPKDSRGAM